MKSLTDKWIEHNILYIDNCERNALIYYSGTMYVTGFRRHTTKATLVCRFASTATNIEFLEALSNGAIGQDIKYMYGGKNYVANNVVLQSTLEAKSSIIAYLQSDL